MDDGGGPRELVWITEGEWAGWARWQGGDPFEQMVGPFHMRQDPDGRLRTGFRAETRHMNAAGAMHGGCILTFADQSLFAIAYRSLEGVPAVTASLNGDFIGPVQVGDLVECTGEVLRAGRSLVFVRGLIETGGEPVMAFSGVLKKVPPRA